jgi:hypothetical protein
MTNTDMTPDQEHEFYARPENQEPQGPPIRRRERMSVPNPCVFHPSCLSVFARPPRTTTNPYQRGFDGQ